jgi:hypothetical protein
MSESETINFEITIRLTSKGKLPREITCFECLRTMHRVLWRKGAVYRC